jgi:hypothetical protein
MRKKIKLNWNNVERDIRDILYEYEKEVGIFGEHGIPVGELDRVALAITRYFRGLLISESLKNSHSQFLTPAPKNAKSQ